jgi:hypothetical protein
MKLDRNNPDRKGRNKYAVVSMRRFAKINEEAPPATREAVNNAMGVLFSAGVLNYGDVNTDREFFVIMLKDRFADAAIGAYAMRAVAQGGENFLEYGREVQKLADRAGVYSPFNKLPD